MQKLADGQTANMEGKICLVTGANSGIGRRLREVSEKMTDPSSTGANP
jgi:hypothetical protein